jgi:probable selenate reductase FAD-binding subunit
VPSITAYYRPTELAEAVRLLEDSNRRALGGGTALVPVARQSRTDGVELVDLQSLGLDAIEVDGSRIRLGAMVRLGDLTDDSRVPELLGTAARRELPSALRNQATVGGTVAVADATSLVVAALIVHEASLEIHGAESMSLVDYLAGSRTGLITALTIEGSGRGAIAATGRTPADEPIVAAVARASEQGLQMALTGVAATPVQVDPADPAAGLAPESDFRGTAEYRTHLVTVNARRVAEELA